MERGVRNENEGKVSFGGFKEEDENKRKKRLREGKRGE